MGLMAQRGKDEFDVKNPRAWNAHARLLELAPLMNDVDLASHFKTTVQTVCKWKKLPLGFPGGKHGRPPKQKISPGT